MKIKKIILSVIALFIVIGITNICDAYTISMDDIKAKKGEEFTLTINVDKQTPLANGHINFDASKLEYIGSDQENMSQNLIEDGVVAWMYVDIEMTGTKSFEFKFRAKENGESQITLDELAFADSNGGTYEGEQISGNTSIYVNKKNNILKIIIAIVIVLIILGICVKIVKKKK